MNKLYKKISIGFIGLSHLGLVSSVAAAEKGFNVIGYDDNKILVNNINNGDTKIVEPKLNYLLKKNKINLNFTSDRHLLKSCNIVYVSKDVLTDKDNVSDTKIITKALQSVIKYFKKNAIIIILSQVPPGFTKKINWPLKQLYYQVETLIFGNAMRRALNPERIILGCYDQKIKIDSKLNYFLKSFNCQIIKMNYESAELTKISINLFLISSITTSNKISEICKKIGANWSEISPALEMDKRIGKYAYIKPGLGIAGGNLERDLKSVIQITNKINVNNDLFKSWDRNSKFMKNWALNEFNHLSSNKRNLKISILGLTYKENTNSIKNSAAIKIIKRMKDYSISTYDPAADKDINFRNLIRFESAINAIKGSDALLIMTPWPEFKNITSKQLSKNMKGKIIIDPYNVFKDQNLSKKGFKYSSIGESL